MNSGLEGLYMSNEDPSSFQDKSKNPIVGIDYKTNDFQKEELKDLELSNQEEKNNIAIKTKEKIKAQFDKEFAKIDLRSQGFMESPQYPGIFQNVKGQYAIITSNGLGIYVSKILNQKIVLGAMIKDEKSGKIYSYNKSKGYYS